MLQRIFSPIEIGSVTIPNRLVVPAMVMNYCNTDGTATERYSAYHEAKARGGWGLIITEDYAVNPLGKGFPNIPGLWEDSQIESHRHVTERVHNAGGILFAQIYHCGRQTSNRVIGCRPVAPSPIPCPAVKEMPRELTVPEIHRLVEEFGDCALRARQAGFDGIEVHGAHGYLIAQFLSSYSNKRTDAYGGNFLNRLRFSIEIIENIRAKAGDDFPVIFRISADEMVPGGRTIEDTKAIAMMLQDAGVHALHVSVGAYGSGYAIIPPGAVGHGWITHWAEEVKKVVALPVITVGRITDPFIAESILASGAADLIAMGRASLADPALPRKAAAGRYDDINACIACMQGCQGMIAAYKPATCLVNPTLGKEKESVITAAETKKKVFIAGGGPAGMETAMVAALRGHEVHLFEERQWLGGQLYLAAIPPAKGEFSGFIRWLKTRLDDLGVQVHLSRTLTEEQVRADTPDIVVIATGSIARSLALPGMETASFVTAQDALEGTVAVGRRTAVIGGGSTGAETAAHLAHHGKSVDLFEMLPHIASDEEATTRRFLLEMLAEKNVRIHVNSIVKEVSRDGILIEHAGMRETCGPFDTVVTAVGSKPRNEAVERMKSLGVEVIVVGDASMVRNALEAVAEGYRAGLSI